MAERRAVRWKRERERRRWKPKRHENGVLVESDGPRSGMSWVTCATPGEASRAYIETVERIRSVQDAVRPQAVRVQLIHLGELRDETLLEATRKR